MSLLAVDDLHVSFRGEGGQPGVDAVRGATLDIGEGETVALVGESGCGKSVTALSVLGLLPYPKAHHPGGSIRLRGEELLGAPADRLRQVRGDRVSMIFQEPMTSLNPLHTVERQVAETLRVHRGLDRGEARRRVLELLDEVRLPEPERMLAAWPHQLSGGQRQRVMIAMALANEPDLLIADEPTTALDVTVQAQILHLMKRLQAELGTAILLITHDMGVVAETCDEVVVMYAGKVVERCGVVELFEGSRHPYTRGLLDSILRPGRPRGAGVPTIEGVVPSLLDPPPGCRFADRCPRAEERCRRQDPPLEPVADGHLAACHYPLEPA